MRNRRHPLSPLLASLPLFSAASFLGAQVTTPAAVSAPAPVSEEKLGGEDLSELLDEVRESANVPGLVAMAIQDGEVVAWAASGVRAVGGNDPMTIHDPIHLGSCSKAMTSTLAATLIEEGLLKWDSTIGEVLPEFAKDIHEGYHGVTIEQLLQHRGGIAERRRPEISALHQTLGELDGNAVDTRREILAMVLEPAPLPPSPNGSDYSNFGYMTAGMMMEAVTKKSYEELIVERLFQPLQMNSAGIGSPHGAGVPVGHQLQGSDWSPLPPGPEGRLHHAMGPAGLLHSNLQDWAKFLTEHVRGEQDEDGLVSAKAYKRLHTDPGSGYAAGWGLGRHRWSFGEAAMITHNGSDGTWHSLCMAIPEWDLIVMSAANASNSAGDTATREAQELMLRCAGFMD